MTIPSLRTGRRLSTLSLALAGMLGFTLCAQAADAPIRIVNCGEQVQSKKRGVCANGLSAEDFKAFAPGVSWYYNWHFDTKDVPPEGVKMEFIPQVWGRDSEVDGLEKYLATHKPRVVLAINEPNLKGQAFLTPEATAELYKKTKAVADKYGLQVVGPNMSLGSPDTGSIKAMDPVEKKELTYTFMIPFLKAFNFYMGDVPVAATAYHTYGNIGELKWATGELYKQFQKPVWVTEYAYWKASSPSDALNYLIQATDYFERSPFVGGYAWFKERGKDNAGNISLLEQESGKLSPLGKAYVNMPVHDADLYYRLPGRLQAESFVTVANSDIEITDDTDGNFDMTSTGPGTFEYNIQVDTAGKYTLKFRVMEKGKAIEIFKGDQSLGTTPPTTESKWQTVEATVELPAGAQKIRVRTGGQTVNWIEFTKS